ncbi:MAG TPA: CDP-alcohol phosphatidyltransferase family protein [Gammaproteobacteria bacterium]|nr:CDP-alcohol phosphatidyltransferase family protein [Gammaproteobacteria bacterium]
MRRLPLMLVYLRLLLAPALLLLAAYHPMPTAFGVCLVLALLSDFFDGIVARRLGVATAGLRRLDSFADTVFCGSAALAVWMLHPEVIRERRLILAALVALEVARYALDLLKFRREASYHMWSAKLWALVLFLAFFVVLVEGGGGVWVGAAILLGIGSDLEGIVISLLLPTWQHDVPSLVHAWRIRALSSPDGR